MNDKKTFKMHREIKVGILVSYDYECIKNSLPPIYEYADKIVLAVDKDNKTWSGNNIHIPDDFWQWLNDFDKQNKIELYKDSFYIEGLTAIQNDTRERTMLGKYMGEGGWHIQVDADEYFIDFKDFVDFLHYLDIKKPRINCVNMQLLSLFKKTSNAFFFIKERDDAQCSFATTEPHYTICRNIKRPRYVLYPKRVIHDSWSRTEEALWTKLKNWGHNNDFDIESYFYFWKVIDEKNYKAIKNFHPTAPAYWMELEKIDASSIQELLQKIKSDDNLVKVKKQKRFKKIRKYAFLFIPPVFIKLYKKLSKTFHE